MSADLALDGDDLAGVVDLFGALTREELDRALAELAFKHDADAPDDEVVETALERYELVDHDGLLVVGPAAFPTLPEGAADLPHILDVPPRTPDTEAVARTAEERFRAEAARALAADPSGEELARLVDASYDIEAWGPVDLGEVRRRLDAARDEQ
ncbi:DUF7109 family protein [Halomarina ordinaria]|uniref:DUF2240 family protein n=1 Tax=Halomarina ordinaria TaxID=3033939 RepID=A0ABD5U7M4_9EURY|nr:hypothetical protein [Halomarina sp. PSRA2]